MLIALAGLTAVPKYLYEAASIDRASEWFRFRHITLPMVWPLLLIVQDIENDMVATMAPGCLTGRVTNSIML